MSSDLVLYSYWRSSASYRVRLAMNLKGLDYSIRPIHLVRNGGEQFAPDYARLNPQRLVPTLVDGAAVLTQSMAMLEYLEERHPEPALLPSEASARARVRAIANAVACDIHPLNNLRVLKYLVGELGLDEKRKLEWYRHWTQSGLAAVEAMLSESPDTGRFCHGDRPTIADCCLLPQVYNAHRFDCDTAALTTIRRICSALQALEPVRQAAPENQPDAE
ncbi:MAG: maleylacetoacetate isomerase [Wenzhouxiangella sp.]|jgi:maleylacetoacetate isomerase|nr:maleylacetoacetate isomerase [Wenzhouxiangella sp.]